jgi:hypothetical protein
MKYIYFILGTTLSSIVLVNYNFDAPTTHCSSVTAKTVDQNWGKEAGFVQALVNESKQDANLTNQVIKFDIARYHGPSIFNSAGLYPGEDSIKVFPDKWIDDVNHNRPVSWHQVFGRSITLKTLLNASKIDQLIEDYPTHWLQNYSYVSVSITGEVENKSVTLMSESNVLNTAQKKMLATAQPGTNYNIVINYSTIVYPSEKEEYERMNIALVVVPEKEAEFPGGMEKLKQYFEINGKSLEKAQLLPDFISVGMKFTIDETGTITKVTPTKPSKYSEIDRDVAHLIKTMPSWIPAQNEAGKPTRQTFELTFGRPGC